MKKILFTALFFLTACSATTGNVRLGDSRFEINEQMKNIKTVDDADALFGKHYLRFAKNGKDCYEYRRVSGSGRYFWLFPVLGKIVSLFQDPYVYEQTSLFVLSDKSGKVDGYDIIETKGTIPE